MKHKNLSEMTLEELWQLFPVTLSPHRSEWAEWARGEMAEIERILDGFHPVINHIGSTAIPDIAAKPIIDILVEIAAEADWAAVRNAMESEGYICMAYSLSRMSFNKGYTPEGYAEKVFHIHFHVIGDHDEILFRDRLRSHPEEAREYEALKRSLLPAFTHNRDGYTAAKTDFVRHIIELTRQSLSKGSGG